MKKIAFIGCGNMGGAIVRAVCAKVDSKSVYLSNRTRSKAVSLAESCGCNVCADNREAAKDADFIFLGVKPWQITDVIREIDEVLKGNEVIVSIFIPPEIDLEDPDTSEPTEPPTSIPAETE